MWAKIFRYSAKIKRKKMLNVLANQNRQAITDTHCDWLTAKPFHGCFGI